MSRQGAVLLFALAAFAPLPLAAQSSPPVGPPAPTASEGARYGPVDARRKPDPCADVREGEDIVVCARPYDQDPGGAGYDKARAEADYAAKTPNRGRPVAPKLGPKPCVPSLISLCLGSGPLGQPKLIDLAAIPEAPPGSDAERIGKGERAE